MSYDLLTRRRVHPAYLWGGALLVNAAEYPSSPTRLRVHLRCPRGHVDQTEYFSKRVLCRDVAEIVSERPATANCPLVLPSPFIPGELTSPSYLHDLCKNVATGANLDSASWHLHRFRDTAATHWLRAANRRQDGASLPGPRIASDYTKAP